MIWFTSDLHLGHGAAISMCERPFETIEEMTEILRYDVGVDANNYYPVSIEQIKDFFEL